MDVIALHRAGFASAVAPLGTALTESQLQELWRLGPEPMLCFDGDTAGQRAAARALRRALPLLQPGHSLRFAALPAGEDPDSLIAAAGRAAFDQILAMARPLSRMLWEIELGAGPADTPERRADLERRLTEDVALIADRTVQGEYRRFIREKLYESGRSAQARWRNPVRLRPTFVSEGPAPRRSPARAQREILFRILLQSPAVIEEIAEEFAALDIPEPELDKLRREILEVEALRPGLDAPALRQHLLLNGFAATVDALLSPSVDFGLSGPELGSARSARYMGSCDRNADGRSPVGLGRSQQSPDRRGFIGELGTLSGSQGARRCASPARWRSGVSLRRRVSVRCVRRGRRQTRIEEDFCGPARAGRTKTI